MMGRKSSYLYVEEYNPIEFLTFHHYFANGMNRDNLSQKLILSHKLAFISKNEYYFYIIKILPLLEIEYFIRFSILLKSLIIPADILVQ
jgi:hypothetical protein